MIDHYTIYHIHTMLSSGTTNIDSITDFHDYVDMAKENGMKAIGFSEHGNIFSWLKKKEYIESQGLKYIHEVEAYLTEDLFQYPDPRFHMDEIVKLESDNCITAEEALELWKEKNWKEENKKKAKDNYHCVLIAKNYDGVKELNKLVSKSFNRNDGHFYNNPRITFDELFATSDNILVTTACLGGVLHKGTPSAKEKFLTFLINNKHRCWLEIQHHVDKDQIAYNQMLYDLSKSSGIPLIVGTDTHSLNKEHAEGRLLLQKSKRVVFSGEEKFNLVAMPTVKDVIDAFKLQNGSIPMDVIEKAIEQTNVMADMIESFELDYSPKYPQMYDNPESVFLAKIEEGIIKRGIDKKPNYQEYRDRVDEEFKTYKHNGAINFMLLEEDYKSEMKRRGIKFGYSRGSVSGSIIAYLLGITEIDSVKYDLSFSRFMNTERVSLADIDTDWFSNDRDVVKRYLHGKEGLYCCDIVTFNTIALKGAIKDVCRGLYHDNIDHCPPNVKKVIDAWDDDQKKKAKELGSSYVEEEYPKEIGALIEKYSIHKYVPFKYLKFSNEVIALAEEDEELARKKYPELFRYVDLVNGVVVSVGNHPAACVVSPFPVDEWFGTFTTSTDEYPISLLNMKEIDSLNFIKLDILGLDNIGLIAKTCELAKIPFATPDNIPADDLDVWNSIKEDTTMIFQWESKSATAYLKQLMSDETIDKIKKVNPKFSYIDLLSVGNGAIRPAGDSYRDKLANGEFASYGNKELDEFMKPTLGWMVYQEQVIGFLNQFCGYTMGMADVVRRGFAKKTGTEKFIPDIKKGFTKIMEEKYKVPKEESDKIIVNFIQVIEDASSYLFSKNHSDPYTWIGYICGYLRYYYPLEFITTALNIFADNEDKSLAIINYAKKRGIKITPIKFRKSGAEYSFNKDTNEIYKGIASIKFMNASVADKLLEVGNNQYKNFVDLIRYLLYNKVVDMRQLKILINLEFFSEFGDENKLLYQLDLFDAFYGKVQVAKKKVDRFGISTDVMLECSSKETDKMFTGVDSYKLLSMMSEHCNIPKRTISDKAKAQIEHLGYVNIIGDEYAGMGCVLDVDAKYSPKLKVYSLKNGTMIDCKISKSVFNKHPLVKGDVISLACEYRVKSKKVGDHFEKVPGTRELWITNYRKVDF